MKFRKMKYGTFYSVMDKLNSSLRYYESQINVNRLLKKERRENMIRYRR